MLKSTQQDYEEARELSDIILNQQSGLLGILGKAFSDFARELIIIGILHEREKHIAKTEII